MPSIHTSADEIAALNAKQILSLAEAACLLDCHVNTVSNWIKRGDLIASKKEGRRRVYVRRADLDKFLAR